MPAGQFAALGLITADGAVRIDIGGPDAAAHDPTGSVQFIGSLDTASDRTHASGVLIGQACAGPTPGRFCGTATPARITLPTVLFPGTAGIQVATSGGGETWALDLYWFNDRYWTPAHLRSPGESYDVLLAEFAADNNVVMSVDDAGRLFFQSPSTGCTGNGTFMPHLDGQFNAYDVSLVIDSCNSAHAYLNGGFEGLATTNVLQPWDYGRDDAWLVWLSRPAAAGVSVALTLLATPVGGAGAWDY
ncbi:MAG: hypothetical protein ABI640_08705 [Gammaproteobacteria bacterium]